MSKQIIFSEADGNQLTAYCTNACKIRIEIGNLFNHSMMEVEYINLSIEDATDLIEVLKGEIELSKELLEK